MSKDRSSFGSRLSRFILVISALGLSLRLCAKGLMSPEKIVIFLLLAVVAAALDSGWVKLIIALFGLGYFLLDFVDYDMSQFQAVATSTIALLVALFGYFVMFGGMRSRK